MFALTRGELMMVIFIFALIVAAGILPRTFEQIGVRLGKPGERGAGRHGG